jgi:hypothetical protein
VDGGEVTVQIHVGDVLEVLGELPEQSVDLVLSSPPFLAVRSYLPADHPDKAKEIGSEPTPGEFVDTILDVIEACDRVLAPHGTLVFEFGDTYCVDGDTEALTRRGWLRWLDLTTDDEVLALGPDGVARWEPVLAVNTFAGTHRMLSVGGRGHSSLTTANHRWIAERRTGRGGSRRYVEEVVTSERLTVEHRIPIAAPVEAPTVAKHIDALVEAVAWYWTEGHDRKPGVGRTQTTGIYIVQSPTVNPHNVARIRRCLTDLFGPGSPRLPGVKGAEPTWAEYRYREDKVEFRLNAAAARVLREYAPGKVVDAAWLTELTTAQLELFIEASVAADGHQRGSMIELAQADKARAEAFQVALVLSGRAASIHGDAQGRWCVTGRTGSRVKPLRHPHEWVSYTGVVWCPTTPSGSWLARRAGHVFYTGNSGSGGAGGDYGEGGLRDGQEKFDGSAKRYRVVNESQRGNTHGDVRVGGQDGRPTIPASVAIPRPGTNSRMQSVPGWPEAKSLCMVPQLVPIALAYGFNPLTGRTTPKWRIRNLHPWVRPNPPVGALGDKWRPATSYLFSATKSARRYFDLDAVRQPPSPNTHARTAKGVDSRANSGKSAADERGGNWSSLAVQHEANGSPPLDWILLPPQPYKGSHYAVWPPKLCTPFIESMCPKEVCRECGEPRRRLVEPTEDYAAHLAALRGPRINSTPSGRHKVNVQPGGQLRRSSEVTTLGFTDCGHGDYRPGVVLDPFAGSGTTLMVAAAQGRNAVGIDINEVNVALVQDRLGLFGAEVITRVPAA